jgi:hypothetical protein
MADDARRKLEEWFAQPRAKGDCVLVVTVSERFAQAVKANPEGVRVYAKGADGVTVMERPEVVKEKKRQMTEAERVERAKRDIREFLARQAAKEEVR